MSEHQEQKALFRWAAMRANQVPELARMFAIPNGGHRHKAVAAKMKAEGVKAGVPDILLPVARGGYHGLFIEMKFGKNILTKSQKDWRGKLTREGYAFVTCWNWLAATEQINEYLEMGEDWE